MFCPNCGKKVSSTAKFCSNCGYDLSSVDNDGQETDNLESASKGTQDSEKDNSSSQRICPHCGKEIKEPDTLFCPYCNKRLYENMSKDERKRKDNQRSPLTAGILLLFFGLLGIHNFYLKQTKSGLVKFILISFSLSLFLVNFVNNNDPPVLETCIINFITIVNISDLLRLYWHKTKTKCELVYTTRNWKLLGIICIPVLIILFAIILLSVFVFFSGVFAILLQPEL